MRNQSRMSSEGLSRRKAAGAPTRADLLAQVVLVPVPLCVQCSPADLAAASPRDALHLQRLAGNRAVSHLLSRAA